MSVFDQESLFDENVRLLVGEDTIIAPARLILRDGGKITDEHGVVHKRCAVFGGAVGDLMLPGAREDQLLLCKMILMIRQAYSATSYEASPISGMRSDQVLASDLTNPKYWDKRLK